MRWRGDETRRDGSQPSTHAAGWGATAMRGSVPAPLQGRRPAAWRGFGTEPTRLRLRLRGDDEVEPPSAPTRDPGNATATSGRGMGRGESIWFLLLQKTAATRETPRETAALDRLTGHRPRPGLRLPTGTGAHGAGRPISHRRRGDSSRRQRHALGLREDEVRARWI